MTRCPSQKKLVQSSGRFTFIPYNETEERDVIGGLPCQVLYFQHRVSLFAFFLLLIVGGKKAIYRFHTQKGALFRTYFNPCGSVVQWGTRSERSNFFGCQDGLISPSNRQTKVLLLKEAAVRKFM